MSKRNRGFTLIELLVVIAIIGILSSIVLASLSTARGKGNDAKIKGQLASMRSAAEIYNSTAGSYGTPTSTTNGCNASPLTGTMWNDGASGMQQLASTGNYPGTAALQCYSTAAAWAAQAKLSDGTYWCVDNTGNAKADTLLGTGAIVCP